MYVCILVEVEVDLTEMGSNHPFKSFQQIDLKSQMTYKSLDHDFRLLITLIHRC